MKKEQLTIRVLPIVRLGLDRNLEKSGFNNLNDYINFILEGHLYKVNQEEKITDAVTERLNQVEEKIAKELRDTTIQLDWNKKLLAKLVAKIGE